MDLSGTLTIREATLDDHGAIEEMTADTWPERPGDDYLGRVYPRWLEAGERPQRTLVVDHEGTAVAIAQCIMLSDTEAWGQGLRVHPDARGHGLSERLTRRLFDWARTQGATVVRAMVHSWNEAGLGQSRASGYDPAGSFRWMHPDPDGANRMHARLEGLQRPWLPNTVSTEVTDDPTTAWRAYQNSRAQTVVGGLGLSLDESWAAVEVTPAMLERAATETAVIAITASTGAEAMAYRSRTFDREDEDGTTVTTVEYGIAQWTDVQYGAALLAAIARDAAALDAERTRVALPESPTILSDAALCRVELAESPEIIVAADLTGTTTID